MILQRHFIVLRLVFDSAGGLIESLLVARFTCRNARQTLRKMLVIYGVLKLAWGCSLSLKEAAMNARQRSEVCRTM
jgi:hypothetical protein